MTHLYTFFCNSTYSLTSYYYNFSAADPAVDDPQGVASSQTEDNGGIIIVAMLASGGWMLAIAFIVFGIWQCYKRTRKATKTTARFNYCVYVTILSLDYGAPSLITTDVQFCAFTYNRWCNLYVI